MPRILVADDDLEQLKLRKLLLERAGHEVALALNPQTALQFVKQGLADVVILDLRFLNARGKPDSTEGLALIRGIHDLGLGTPLIVLSGWPDDLYGQPEELLVSRIMIKPVKISVLLIAIEELSSKTGAPAPDRSHFA